MKRILKRTVAVVISAAILIGTAPVKPVVQAAPRAKKITLNVKSKKLKTGEKLNLMVKSVKPSKASKAVTWKSSKKTVAAVSKREL